MLTFQAAHVYRILSQTGPLEALKAVREVKEDGYSFEQYLREESGAGEVKGKKKSRLDHFKMAASLVDHSANALGAFSATSTAHHIVLALKVVALLDIASHSALFKENDSNDHHHLLLELAHLALSFIRRLIFNVFGFETSGHCLCLVASLVNHSCAPNTRWSWSPHGEIVFRSSQPIGKGEQITISYGPYKEMDYDARQNTLNQYLFEVSHSCHSFFTEVFSNFYLSSFCLVPL